MSLAIRSARSRYQGDPGLFGAIGGAIGGFLKGGPGGAIAGAMSGWRGTSTAVPPILRLPAGAAQAMPGTGIQVRFPTAIGGGIQIGTGIAGLGYQPQSMSMVGGGGTALMPSGGCAPMVQGPDGKLMQIRGYHVNKSNYYRHKSRIFGVDAELVKAGTACVRNRTMNPLNPRALSRALRRIVSAKRAVKFLSRVSVRSGCAPARRASSGKGKKSCK